MISLEDLDLGGKTIFLRVDFNVPLDSSSQIRNDARIQAALPTIRYILEKKARIIVASHLGRPKGKIVPKLSMSPVAKRLAELISAPVKMSSTIIGAEVEVMKNNLNPGEVLVLENLRFDPGEKSNDPLFAEKLASGIDIYINDAFGACHRTHASVAAIIDYVKLAAPGFLIKKEIAYLDKVIHSPQKPFTAILGGAKVSDKIPIINKLLFKADSILIGGAMAYTFFSAQGMKTGRSLVEDERKELALEFLETAQQQKVNLMLPSDHVVAPSIDSPNEAKTISGLPIPENLMALDIGPETIKDFSSIISKSKTILWNGPMGVFEVKEFSNGTLQIAQSIASSDSMSIVGGGDSVSAIAKSGVGNNISHISTGGGASLEYIANETLPGLEALSGEQK